MQQYFIKTFGCAMNFSDSERLATFLEDQGLCVTKKIEKADFVIINSCGVRQMSEDRAYGQIHNLKKTNSKIKIILTGCVAHRKDVQNRLRKRVNLFTNIKDFPKKFKTKFTKNIEISDKFPSQEKIDYLSINPKTENSFSALIPIMTGCNNFCAYCVVPYARGREKSRPHKEIIKEVRELIKKGYKEIFLLGQNVNSYQSPDNKKIGFGEILEKIDDLPGTFWIRFMTPHPKDMTEELIKKITSLDKVCEMIHLPIQSGDNTILKSMNRRYTRKEYLHRISLVKKYFEKNKPQKLYSISTDIIVGFPQETKSRLENSAKVMRKAQYDMVYFGQFSPRPGTAAWQMKDNVKKQEKARREKCLNEILKKTAYANNKKYIGTFQDVLVEKEKNGFYFGKTRTFKNVKAIITKDYCPELVEGSLIGQIIPVKITAANIWNLEGEFYKKKKVVVILGPTASGKSSAAIKLAKKFNGEIISADSRQIYKGMDIGSGKITKTEQKMIPHYMIDIVSPKTDYNVAKFKKQSLKHIEGILSRGKTPIIAGGTGFWIKAIVDDAYFPEVKPDWKLRQKLEKKSTSELFKKLKKTDPQRAKNIDAKNPVRLIRAIEICVALGRVPKKENKENKKYEFLQIGIKRTKENIHERIKMNVEKRFKKGMVKEVENLHEEGVSWKRLRSFGLSYSLIPDFLQGKIDTKEILKEKIYLAEKNYAKRQMTWFQRDKRIKWLADYDNIEKETKKFLK